MSYQDKWARCPECRMERRVASGRMTFHRRWDAWNHEMIPCPGSGQMPVETTP